jgi:hypothetical protein
MSLDPGLCVWNLDNMGYFLVLLTVRRSEAREEGKIFEKSL